MNEYIKIGLVVLTFIVIIAQIYIIVWNLLDYLWTSNFNKWTLIAIITLLLLPVTIPFGYWVINF